ncbi:hypothetical protein CHLRE_16g678200v5 [Chlamydomonas reinhardtii]|uniref:VOC domain-containing protein n=1 Tax=Chlamydomonas reinhardtii TaxID=3055 RepID=A0A2K3CV90_CHLRE|nr:uncharacterized protein CHLRE_16g678200v5 [Chlamydomonas reinhardtii]PNW72196.1 hypothetical protein CHLRE_16g678200v5 [Chlamydomonas reinhardtii]
MGPQQEPGRRRPLPLKALNHVSRCCEDVARSFAFYTDVLGFIPVKRPTSFEFEGAWMFNYGIGLHLVKGNPAPRDSKIEPKTCHISFQVSISLEEMEAHLKEWGLDYVKQVFVEDGVEVGQLFFHDPDNNMIAPLTSTRCPLPRMPYTCMATLLIASPSRPTEVCNCHELPVVPLAEGLLACANVAAINSAAAVAAATAVELAATPGDAVSCLAAALTEMPALMAAPPAAAAAAGAAITKEMHEHVAASSSGIVRHVATAPSTADTPDPAASPKMPLTPPSCDATTAVAAAVPTAIITTQAQATAAALPPPHLNSTPASHLLADEAGSTCSCSLDSELQEPCGAADDASSSAACGSVAGGGPRRSHSFGSSSMFSGFSGSLASVSMPSGLLVASVREAAAAGRSRSVRVSELDEWLSLLGTVASEPVPAGVKDAGASAYAYLASPAGASELVATPPGLSGLSCMELGTGGGTAAVAAAAVAERKQCGEQASQLQQQHIYSQYLRQRLAVGASAAPGAGAGGPKAGSGAGEAGDLRKHKMQEHAAMVGVISAMGSAGTAASATPTAVL